MLIILLLLHQVLARNGCLLYKTKADTLRFFFEQQTVETNGEEENIIHLQQFQFMKRAKALSFAALGANNKEHFRIRMEAQNSRWRKKGATSNIMKLPSDTSDQWETLWKASRCIVPMYSELGTTHHGVEDHLRKKLTAFKFKKNSRRLISIPFKQVSSACARLAVSYFAQIY